MSSPQRVQIELQNEIKRRINHDSPTKYDIDFYLRKINRLEHDLNLAQDELSKVRVKLRRAQDFQIKYDLILKQNSNLQNDLERIERQLCDNKAINQGIKAKLEEKQGRHEDWSLERRNLQDQIDKWKNKYQESQDRRTNFMLENRQKSDNYLKKEIDLVKRDFSEKEENYQFQIRQLKKTVHEKETVETVVGMRVQKIRKEKDQEIKRLSNIIEKLKGEHLEAIKQKNDQFDKLREKFQKMFNFQLQNLKKNLDDQDELFNIQINGLRQMIGLKNDEISKILQEMKKQTADHQKDRKQLLEEIKALKQKIYVIERENQLELYNVKERLTKIHSLDIQSVEKRYQDLINTLKGENAELHNLLKERDRLVEAEKKQLQRVRNQLLDRIKERQGRIKQLQERIKDSGDMNDNELKNLHQSFHKIQSEKELMTNDYQANVGFLNQQIAKQAITNQMKNNQIKQLHQDIANLKRTYAQNMKDLQNKWRQERKDRQIQREKQRENREKIEDDYRRQEKEWKTKERQLEREKQKQQREKNKLKYIVEELQKDIERLNQYIKQLDQNLKNQYKKNQTSTLDTGGIRRELTSELDRQNAQLEAIKRMEVDQIQKKYEIEVTKLTNLNQKLQTDLLNKSLAFQNLENQFKKLEHINKNIDKINKQKLLEYQKKMATLNNQINLTQNLYQSFLQAKSRTSKKSS